MRLDVRGGGGNENKNEDWCSLTDGVGERQDETCSSRGDCAREDS